MGTNMCQQARNHLSLLCVRVVKCVWEIPREGSGTLAWLCDRSAIGRPNLALFLIQTHTVVGVLNHLVLNCLESFTVRLWCYGVYNAVKPAQNQNAIEAAIKRDRCRKSQQRARPRLNSQPQGATKVSDRWSVPLTSTAAEDWSRGHSVNAQMADRLAPAACCTLVASIL